MKVVGPHFEGDIGTEVKQYWKSGRFTNLGSFEYEGRASPAQEFIKNHYLETKKIQLLSNFLEVEQYQGFSPFHNVVFFEETSK